MKKILSIITTILFLSSSAYSAPWSSSSGSGVETDSNCNQAKYFAIGKICQDTDDGKLYKGTGAAVLEITSGGDFTGPASSTGDNFVSFNGVGGKTGKDSGYGPSSFEAAMGIAATGVPYCTYSSGCTWSLKTIGVDIQAYSAVLDDLADLFTYNDETGNLTLNAGLITTKADGYRRLAIMENTGAMAPTATAYEQYIEAEKWKLNEKGVEYYFGKGLSPIIFTTGGTTERTVTLPDANVTIPANPIGGTLGATANVIPKANGTGTATLQASGITEDGTKVDVGALNLVTTGTITGAIPIITKSDEGANSITAAQALGSMIWLGHVDAISDLALPDYTVTASTSKAKIGSSVCVMAASAYAHTIHPSSTDKIRTSNGTLNAVGAGVTYTTASTPIGGFTCFLLTDAPVKGTASGATTDTTGYATTTTTITLASAGTGTILIGDIITFAGDTTQYTITAGDADVSGGGTLTFTPGLAVAIETSAHAITVVESAIGIWTQMGMNGTWPIH